MAGKLGIVILCLLGIVTVYTMIKKDGVNVDDVVLISGNNVLKERSIKRLSPELPVVDSPVISDSFVKEAGKITADSSFVGGVSIPTPDELYEQQVSNDLNRLNELPPVDASLDVMPQELMDSELSFDFTKAFQKESLDDNGLINDPLSEPDAIGLDSISEPSNDYELMVDLDLLDLEREFDERKKQGGVLVVESSSDVLYDDPVQMLMYPELKSIDELMYPSEPELDVNVE